MLQHVAQTMNDSGAVDAMHGLVAHLDDSLITCFAVQHLPGWHLSGRTPRCSAVAAASAGSGSSTEAAEAAVLEALTGVKGRGSQGLPPDQLRAFEDAVKTLEVDGGVEVGTSTFRSFQVCYTQSCR